MFEIFGSAIPAVDDLESRFWIVEVAKSEGLGFTVQDLPCAALCKCSATWASATRGAFLGSEFDFALSMGAQRRAIAWRPAGRLSLTPTFGVPTELLFPQTTSPQTDMVHSNLPKYLSHTA
jgi:hypothetical protein